MTEILQPTRRRALLVRGLAVLSGAFGLAVIDKKAHQGESSSPDFAGGETLRLYGRQWHVHAPAQQSRNSGGTGHRLLSQGELWDRPDGEKIGEFYSTRFCLESAFGVNPLAASNLEFQTFQLRDGTLFGMTAGAPELDEKAHAVLGGTGRYAGVRGSYVMTRSLAAGKPSIEIVLTLTT